jgi:hypothetical protein
MKDRWELMPSKIENFEIKNAMAGGSAGDHMRKNLLWRAFECSAENEIFIMADVDIVFYKPCFSVVMQEFLARQWVKIGNDIIQKEVDLVSQMEYLNGMVNMGFMAMKNNDRVRNFWKEVYEISLGEGQWDQMVMNKVLYDNISGMQDNIVEYKNNEKLLWKRFPKEIWNMTIGVIDAPIFLHHANCAISKEEKFNQFEMVRQKLKSMNFA